MSHNNLGVSLWCWIPLFFKNIFRASSVPFILDIFLCRDLSKRPIYLSLSPGALHVSQTSEYQATIREFLRVALEVMTYKRAIRMKTLNHINAALNLRSELYFFWGYTEDFLKKHSSIHRKVSCTEAGRSSYYKNKVI